MSGVEKTVENEVEIAGESSRGPVTIARSKQVVEEMLQSFPKRTGDVRRTHVIVKDACEVEQKIEANNRTIPGILTNRGCAYAGSKGVVFGPIKDILHITHGPIGCAYFTWGSRRNLMRAEEGRDCFAGYCLSTDVKETDIVFGAEKKLAAAIREAYAIFKPECISVFCTCPIGLIGDDIEAVSKKKAKEHGKTMVPVRCEGFRGVSQSLGHHIANDAVRDWVFDNKGGAEQNDDSAFETSP